MNYFTGGMANPGQLAPLQATYQDQWGNGNSSNALSIPMCCPLCGVHSYRTVAIVGSSNLAPAISASSQLDQNHDLQPISPSPGYQYNPFPPLSEVIQPKDSPYRNDPFQPFNEVLQPMTDLVELSNSPAHSIASPVQSTNITFQAISPCTPDFSDLVTQPPDDWSAFANKDEAGIPSPPSTVQGYSPTGTIGGRQGEEASLSLDLVRSPGSSSLNLLGLNLVGGVEDLNRLNNEQLFLLERKLQGWPWNKIAEDHNMKWKPANKETLVVRFSRLKKSNPAVAELLRQHGRQSVRGNRQLNTGRQANKRRVRSKKKKNNDYEIEVSG